MSEYQCYEFVALDRQLTSKEMAELRAISTRAEISPTRFWNEYQWGNLKADSAKLLARYFDAHLYFANWGTRRFMLRLPVRSVEVAALKPYFMGHRAKLTKAGAFVVLDFWSDDEERDDDEEWFEGGRLAALTPLRAKILQGDLSAAYVAWLSSVQSGDVDDDAREPVVPSGLGNLAAPIATLVEVLRVDRDLVAAAAEASSAPAGDSKDLRAWIKARPTAEKDRWLLHAVDHPESALGVELRAAFRKGRANGSAQPHRTAGALLARAEQLRKMRTAAEAVANKRARVAADRAREGARPPGQAPADSLDRSGEARRRSVLRQGCRARGRSARPRRARWRARRVRRALRVPEKGARETSWLLRRVQAAGTVKGRRS